MLLYIILSIILILVCLFVTLHIVSKNKFNVKTIKIEEAENELTSLLNNKLDLMQKINKAVKKKTKEDYLEGIDSIKGDGLSNIELHKELSKYDKPLIELIEFNKDIKLTEKDDKLLDDLSNTNVNCRAATKFYNDNVEIYNKLLTSFPYKITAKLMKLKEKELFVEEKEEIFEILKQ